MQDGNMRGNGFQLLLLVFEETFTDYAEVTEVAGQFDFRKLFEIREQTGQVKTEPSTMCFMKHFYSGLLTEI